jgi:SAM-dependent methyltransferase
MLTGERQVAPDLEGIHLGHIRRYQFARDFVAGKVLDAACGVGYGSRMLHDACCDVTGIDLEPEAIEYARKHYSGPRYEVGDVREYAGEFNWIVSFETLEHLPDPERMLKNFRLIGDFLVVSTPNQTYYPFRKESYEGDTYPHHRHYTFDELGALLRATQWTVEGEFCQPRKDSEVVPGGKGMFLVFVCS